MTPWQTVFSAFNPSSFDAVVIGVVVVLLAIDVFQFGTRHIAALAFALPATLFLYSAIPHASFIGPIVSGFAPLLQASVCGLLFIITWVLAYRLFDSYGGGMSGSLLSAIGSGLAGAALLITFWLQVPALQSVWQFGPDIQSTFGSPYAFWWVIGCYLVLALISL